MPKLPASQQMPTAQQVRNAAIRKAIDDGLAECTQEERDFFEEVFGERRKKGGQAYQDQLYEVVRRTLHSKRLQAQSQENL